MTSKFEPFGVALIEAKSAGLPIVSTSVGVVSDLVENGESGLVCPSGDYERLAAAFVSLADDAALRRRLGDRALRDAHSRHSLHAVVGQYEQLYDEAKGAAQYDRTVVVAGRLPVDQE
jgi:glycosyltransferase involved in cell wall biosynthesis